MTTYHQPIYEDIGGNNNFTSFSSNINDISLISIYWNDINLKPSFCNICFTSSYNDLINTPSFATVATTGNYNDLTNKPFIISNNNIYNTNSGFVGIGTNNPQYNLDINGDINFTGSLNQNNSEFKTSQWLNSNTSIYYTLGNIGIGKSTNISEKLDIVGNIKIDGDIYPSSNNYYNLGTSNNKWKDLFLSGNSIYLDTIIISKNENNNLELKNNNNNYIGITVNEIELNSNANNFKIKLNEFGDLIYNYNNCNYYPVSFNNSNDISNIIYNNDLIASSNILNNKIDNITTDTIQLGTNNRFIINDTYNRNITFTQNLTSSNIITSNLNVIGDITTINTTVYQTEQLQVINNTAYPALYIKQLNSSYNISEFYKDTQLLFLINSNGNIGIGVNNPNYTVDINGSLNSGSILIQGTNISNIIDNKIAITSNIIVNYSNLINKPLLSTVAISGNYNDLINKIWDSNNNNIYNLNIGNIGIGTNNPQYKLDITGSLNVNTDIFINNTNISNIINNKITNNSNILVNYSSLINRPLLSTVALSGSYTDLIDKPTTMEGTSNFNDLINKPWINNNNNIYNTNIGNVGIGISNPQYKLDINGSLNTNNEIYVKNVNISNIIDAKITDTSNIIVNYNNLINKPSLSLVATTGNYDDLSNKPSLATVAISGNYNDLNNKTWININNNIYNANSGFVGIGITNPQYKLDINGSLNTNNEIYVKNINISNVIDNKILNASNNLNTKINAITTDTLPTGTNNRFIINDIYNRNITFTQTLTSSNIITSNLSVIGDTTTLNTTVYQTEQLQIVNDTTATPIIIKQLNTNYNVAEFYNNTQLTFLINSNGNIGINNINPQYKLDINGSLNTNNEIYVKNINISNIIDNKILITSNQLVNYNNLINKPSLATVATTGNYNDLINKPWNIYANDISNTNSGFIGIGTTNPQYKLDINGSLNTNSEIYINNTNVSNIIDNKIVITSNILINYCNLINRPTLSTVATSGDYNDLINKPVGSIGGGGVSDYNDLTNKPWINLGSNIYNSNSFNVGIGKTNPQYKLDINGDVNINGSLRMNNSIIPFSTYSNTNIIASNASFAYSNSSHGYYMFLTNGSITFPQNTNCDLLVVGAGGNGGSNFYSGGGGAGEVIYFPNYLFTMGTYSFIIGSSSTNSNNRITTITSNSNNIFRALGGGSGGGIIQSITNNTSITLTQNANMQYNFNSFININPGTYNITFANGVINITGFAADYSYPLLKSTNGNTINPNLWCKFDTGLITTNDGSDAITLTNNNSATNPNVFIKGNNSINLNGTNQFLTGTITGIAGSSWSVSVWIYSRTNAGQTGAIVSFGSVGTSFQCITVGYNMNTSGCYGHNDFNSEGSTASYPGDINTWVHLVFMYDASTRTRYVYRNGVRLSLSIPTAGAQTNPDTAISIGKLGSPGIGFPFNGYIDDLRIYKGLLLTDTQIIELYRGRVEIYQSPLSGGSGGGGAISQQSAVAGTKWNATYSYVNSGSNGTSLRGGNGGSAINGGFIETITGTNLIMGIGGNGATSNSVPVLRTSYGSGGDGNGGFGTQGIIIIKVPLNIITTKFDGYINYNNIVNTPYINDLVSSKKFIDIGYYNQVNFPLANISFANEWFIYTGTSPTNTNNSLIFWHLTSNINSKWWFNGTIANTNNEISDERVKKEISNISNPLEKLMLLEPKEYMLCDDKNYLKKYGIIAQDVKQTLPDFVYTDNDYIANIYTTAIYIEDFINDNYIYKLQTAIDISNLINIYDELKLLLDNNNDKNTEIIIEDLPYHNRYKKRFVIVKSIIDNYTIEITEKIECSDIEKLNIFIYGKKVNDFLKLDYSSLYSLTIASTQKLYELILNQQKILDDLNKKYLN
jgi:hypothetical protein